MLDEELIRFKTKLIKLLNLLDKKKQNRVPGEIRLNRINGMQRYEIKEYGSDLKKISQLLISLFQK